MERLTNAKENIAQMTKANRTKLKRKYDRNYFVLSRNGGNRRSQIPDKSAFVTIFESKLLHLATMLTNCEIDLFWGIRAHFFGGKCHFLVISDHCGKSSKKILAWVRPPPPFLTMPEIWDLLFPPSLLYKNTNDIGKSNENDKSKYGEKLAKVNVTQVTKVNMYVKGLQNRQRQIDTGDKGDNWNEWWRRHRKPHAVPG